MLILIGLEANSREQLNQNRQVLPTTTQNFETTTSTSKLELSNDNLFRGSSYFDRGDADSQRFSFDASIHGVELLENDVAIAMAGVGGDVLDAKTLDLAELSKQRPQRIISDGRG